MSNNPESTPNRPEEENRQGATPQLPSAQSEPSREEENVQPSQEILEIAQQLAQAGFSLTKRVEQQAEALAQTAAEVQEVQMDLLDEVVNLSPAEAKLAQGVQELQKNAEPVPLMDVQTQATEQINNIPFEYLIGAPLSAAIKAQSAAAKETVDFIETVGFTDKNELRTISFQYQKSLGNGQNQTVTLTVPLLTIVPIPFLRIDDMNINFKAKINAITKEGDESSKQEEKKAESDIKGGGWGFWMPKVSLTGSVSSKSDSKSSRSSEYSVEYTMDINVHATQDGMPAGMQLVLSKLTDSINEKTSTGGKPSGS